MEKNSSPKLDVAICFRALLLMISFEDLISVFYWVFNTTTEGIMKIYSVKKKLLPLFDIWPKKLWF